MSMTHVHTYQSMNRREGVKQIREIKESAHYMYLKKLRPKKLKIGLLIFPITSIRFINNKDIFIHVHDFIYDNTNQSIHGHH